MPSIARARLILGALALLAFVAALVIREGWIGTVHAGSTILVGDPSSVPDGAFPYTCGDSTNPCDTIQHGIDHASNGDTVLVAAGIYVETIDFRGKAVTVTSAAGPNSTIIDANSAGTVVTFSEGEGPASVLSRFTLRHGFSGFGGGGGITVRFGSPTVTGNVISDNQACEGVGMFINVASPLVKDNVITRNTQSVLCSGGGGGGMELVGAGSAQIVSNIISDNRFNSGDGGGISLFAAGTPTISGNVIVGNTATGESPCSSGGGIDLVNASNALIVNNILARNRAGCGGGIRWLVPFGERGPTVINNTIVDNDAAQGSGIAANGSDARTQVTNNIVVANPGQAAVACGGVFTTQVPQFSFNDVLAPGGTAYAGVCPDQTGSNGNSSADPLFVNQVGGDYHLRNASPAIDAGTNAGGPGTDIEGNPRPLDGNNDGIAVTDIGAYEFVPATTATPTSTPTATATPTPTPTLTPTATPLPAVGGISFDPEVSVRCARTGQHRALEVTLLGSVILVAGTGFAVLALGVPARLRRSRRTSRDGS